MFVSNEEVFASGQTLIYPNPSNGLFNVLLPKNLHGFIQVNVYDHLARLVSSQQETSGSFQIEVTGAPGLYFIEMIDEKGLREVQKVLLQKAD